MNCWHCDTQLIWGGDHDLEDFDLDEPNVIEYDIVTNLHCPKNVIHTLKYIIE